MGKRGAEIEAVIPPKGIVAVILPKEIVAAILQTATEIGIAIKVEVENVMFEGLALRSVTRIAIVTEGIRMGKWRIGPCEGQVPKSAKKEIESAEIRMEKWKINQFAEMAPKNATKEIENEGIGIATEIEIEIGTEIETVTGIEIGTETKTATETEAGIETKRRAAEGAVRKMATLIPVGVQKTTPGKIWICQPKNARHENLAEMAALILAGVPKTAPRGIPICQRKSARNENPAMNRDPEAGTSQGAGRLNLLQKERSQK